MDKYAHNSVMKKLLALLLTVTIPLTCVSCQKTQEQPAVEAGETVEADETAAAGDTSEAGDAAEASEAVETAEGTESTEAAEAIVHGEVPCRK